MNGDLPSGNFLHDLLENPPARLSVGKFQRSKPPFSAGISQPRLITGRSL